LTYINAHSPLTVFDQCQFKLLTFKKSFVPGSRLRHQLVSKVYTKGIFAGLTGGTAEVAWITFYARVSGGEDADIARGVTGIFFSNFTEASLAIPLGIAVHMDLAVMLGAAIVVLLYSLLPRISGTVLEPFIVVGLLIAVWAVNFFVVLPVIIPPFVHLVPYEASLISKILFGVALAPESARQAYSRPS
jgi:hypothetical protein